METVAEQRAAYIEGLRQLADLLETHDILPVPYLKRGNHRGLDVDHINQWRHTLVGYVFEHHGTAEERREEFAEIARTLKPVNKHYPSDGDSAYLWLELGGIDYAVRIARADVCERRVVAVVEDVAEVPDPVEVAKLPTVRQVTRREIVEWECTPLLEPPAPAAEDLMDALGGSR